MGERGAERAIGDARAMLPLDLIDVVFSWTLDDICNPHLFRNEIVKIPLIFKSVIHYLGSYIFPLLEEVREDFCSSLRSASVAPFSEVSSICARQERIYEVRVETWKNGPNNSEDDYRPMPGDILLFTAVNPATVSDVNRFGRSFHLAEITRSEGDKESLTSFQVKMSEKLEGYDDMLNPFFAVCLLNLTAYGRVWKALHVGNSANRDESMIKEVLSTNNLSKNAGCDRCNLDIGSSTISECLSELNESQSSAVIACVADMQCNHQPTVNLIWGPPGTGKTKTISELLWMSISMKHNILTCAPTNISLIEVSSRFLGLVRRKRTTRIGNDTAICLLGDILLVGNKWRLKIPEDTDLLEIFLDHRIDRLVRCFAPSCGWGHCFSSFQDFLKNYKSHYVDARKEHEAGKSLKAHADSSNVYKKFTTLAEFFRMRFSALASPLRFCVIDLCTHMPMSFLSETRLGYLKGLVNILDHFDKLLCRITDEDLKSSLKICGGFSVSDDEDETLMMVGNPANLFCSTWRKCLNNLKLLHGNMPVPTFFEKERVREFCISSSKVVFCTALTSFKMIGVKSFDILVVDEALQLKECDSTVPLQVGGIRHAILIGDEHQLPSTVKSKLSEHVGFGRSLFERLSTLGHPKHLLKMQYRMHPSISLFPNKTFYAGLIVDAPNVSCRSYKKSFLPGKMYCTFSLINVVDGKEELLEVGHSMKNVMEAAVVLQIVQNVFNVVNTREHVNIGIISPYEAQVALIQRKIGNTYDAFQNFRVRVKSVDGFQGGEADVIIISLVRSNPEGSIGFLSNYQRANVALTRARHCLWIVGNIASLSKSCSVWSTLVHDAETRSCIFNADEDESLLKAIIKVKEVILQLDDLLNKDSVLFRNARWKVLFSDNFKKSFTKIKSNTTKRVVIAFLLKLAEGWRPKKNNTIAVAGSNVQFVRQYKVVGLYVICTTELMRISLHTQVLKIWDILPLCEIPVFLKRLENMFLTYTDDYIARCNAKSIEGKLEVPLTWYQGTDPVVQYKHLNNSFHTGEMEDVAVNDRTCIENSKISESLMLMKFYSLSSGVVGHLLSACNGSELVLPFVVTDEERDIILFPQSAFILGRSGTGKTTILTTKLIQREQLYHISTEGMHDSILYSSIPLCKTSGIEGESGNMLRQLFVTVSPKLCSAIADHICRMRSLACSGGQVSTGSFGMHDIGDDVREFADVPDNFSDLNVMHYPLIITFQKFLMMPDGSVGRSFFARFRELRGLLLDERGYWRFPAFHAFLRRKEVNYDRFVSVYWPHFNVRRTNKIDSSFVFKEIISHIKGGLACEMHADVLSRENYVLLARKRSSVLNTEIRNEIFEIYLDYEREKNANGDFDMSDFVNDLHKRLRVTGGFDGDKVDYVYVDEVQDLSMKQIALLKYVSRNMDEGFVFAGDTAQCIARGIDFRFQDVRSLFYSEFLLCKDASKADLSSACNLFHLRQNFRTHAGVLKLGQSVIDLLYFFFPQSVDRLSPEYSSIYGEIPSILECQEENAIVTIFGGTEHGYSYNGFGADQVILVRDNIAKEQILKNVGNQALVLTILECKGLEFQDVLLYNFFGSSPLKNHWRVVYDYMESHNLLDVCTSYQCFEVIRHNLLCSELKQLYVAITRTKQRLWICEMEKEYSKPIFDYWKKLSLVQTRELNDNLLRDMHVGSSKEEWRDRGNRLFREGNYEMATMCFDHFGDLRLSKWAWAATLRDSGIQLLHSNYEKACLDLTRAAEIYESIGRADTAAECYIELGQYQTAGLLYLKKCSESRLEDAGDCFFLAECWSRAAKAFARAKNVSKCLSACLKGKLFDLGLKFIEGWKSDKVSVDIARDNEKVLEIKQSFLVKGAVYYHGLIDKTNMLRCVRASASIESFRKILSSCGCQMLIEEEHGNYGLAAEIARQKGDLIFESKMLEKIGHYEEASKLILLHVTINSLWGSGKKACPLRNVDGIEILLDKAVSLSEKVSYPFFRAVWLEACILSPNKSRSLKDLGELLHGAWILKNIKAEYFTIRKILDVQLLSDPSKFHWQADARLPTMTKDENGAVLCSLTLTSLMHMWNRWKEIVASILACINSLENGRAVHSKECETFCFDYFGARKKDPDNYIILNSEACWIKNTGCRSYCKKGDLTCLEGRHLLLAAYRHWSSELFFMGVKVRQKLELLYDLSRKWPLSLLFQGVILHDTFLVSKFLVNIINSDGLNINYKEKLDFIDIFLECMFPFDWRRILTRAMRSLRESDAAKELLTDAIIGIMSLAQGNLTYGKIGRLAMFLFKIICFGDTDKRICNFFREATQWPTFIERLQQSSKLDTQWHTFIERLQRSSKPYFNLVSLVSSLHDALRSTFDVNFRQERDCMSPNCFLYLLERLLFLASYCRGFYFTTTSSFIEGMAYLGWDVIGANSSFDEKDRIIVEECFNLVVYVSQTLLSNMMETMNWMRSSGLPDPKSMRLLVLRLVIMVGLVHANTRRHFKVVVDLLYDSNVSSHLPGFFAASLGRAGTTNYLGVFAEALDQVQDPLVAVGSHKGKPDLSMLIATKTDVTRGRDQILDMLFPKHVETERLSDDAGLRSSSQNPSPVHLEGHFDQDQLSDKRSYASHTNQEPSPSNGGDERHCDKDQYSGTSSSDASHKNQEPRPIVHGSLHT